jgi:amino acid adenylation domain-containing protein
MKRQDIQDIYPLSPLQEGLLFESLQDPEAGVYFEQLRFRFEEGLDLDAWKAAWEKVVQRHQVLRTAIVWRNLDKALQVVCKSVSIPWQLLDWRMLEIAEQQEQLKIFLAEDRGRGFDFERAPLLRMTVIRLAEHVHEFVCSHHHILLDGWSTSIVLKDVLHYYKNSTDLPRPRPYKEYIEWLNRQDLARAERFWCGFFVGFSTPTRLSSGYRERKKEDGQQNLKTSLTREFTAKLNSFTRSRNITLNALITAAWGFLLSRYSGQADVAFGVALSGRPAALEGVEDMVGLFINVLPLRVLTPPEIPALAWLEDVQARLLDVQDYSYTPLFKVKNWTQVPPGIPLIESIVAFDNYPADLSRRDVRVEAGISEISSIEVSSFPLGFIATPTPELLLTLAYDIQSFSSSIAGQMMRHMRALLQKLVDSPQAPLSEISILTDEEQRLVLENWNETARDYPLERTIHELFEARVVSAPQAPALLTKARQLTFAELNEKANQLAHCLRSMGAGPDMLVGICIERSPEMIIGLLGILKSGAAYVPLDPHYPPERLHFFLEDAAISILVTRKNLVNCLSRAGLHTLCLDSDWDRITRQPLQNPVHLSSGDNIVYCIYTSGSTGRPKGVLVPHRGICNTLLWVGEALSLNDTDRVLLTLSYSFDASVWQIFGTLIAGSTLFLTASNSFDSSEVVAAIVRHGITITDFVPSTLYVFLEEPGVDRCSSLRYVLCGGEAMNPELRNKFFRYVGATLLNVYGPTEVSIDATSFACTPQDKDAIVPIGRPIANKQVYILDDHFQPVPLGVAGELFIGGEGLARGYLNRPDLSAEKFIPNPFGHSPGARMYRTGDLARFLPDGSIQYIGRVDNQVKIRGFRVELGEIEAILATHPEVRECVVVARDDPQAGKNLLAYVVAENVTSPLNLRSFLEAKLPSHMVPAEILILDKLPANAVGKVDRERLPAPVQLRRENPQIVVQSGTPIAEFIAEVWRQVLGVRKPGRQDNFFSLGGHSLAAVRVISRLRAAFKAELPLRMLFDFPNLSSLAEAIEEIIKKKPGQRPPLLSRSRSNTAPMSFAQQRLWFVDRLIPNSPLYNMPACLCFRGILDAKALQAAMDQLVNRHESLRTVFSELDGELVQIILPQMHVPLGLVDLGMVPEGEREKNAQHLASSEAQRPFDLTRGPLLRSSLLRLNAVSHWLLLTVHHIVADGWSISILLAELAELYNSAVNGVKAALAPVSIQYADFAEWQQNWLRGEVLRSELDYWKEQLRAAPALLQLPTDRPRPATQTFSGSVYNFTISNSLAHPLQYLSRKEPVTMFMVFLAAFKVLLLRYSSQESIVVASPVAGRNCKEVEQVIGLFINTIVFHTRLSKEMTFRQAVSNVREVCLGAYMHQEVPFEKIVEDVQPVRDASYTPIFQVMFELQSASARKIEFHNLSFDPAGVENHTAKFDLTLDLQESPVGLQGSFEYSTDLFDRSTIVRMAGHLKTLISAAGRNPDQRIGELQLLTDVEREQLTFHAGPSSLGNKRTHLVHRLFEEQASQKPEAVAIVSDSVKMTYRELNQRANQLASHFRSLGVGPESVVAVCMERSPELIAALLGIWKAGGAYVPLDPSHPLERLAYMIEQVRAPLLVTADGLRPDLLSCIPNTLRIDFDSGIFRGSRNGDLSIDQAPDSLAYVIFTSGSTGNPKGVMVSQASLFNTYLGWEKSYRLFSDASSHLQMANFSFDVFVGDLTRALCSGGKLVICPQELLLAPEKLCGLMQAEKVDFAEFVPAVMRILVAHLEETGQRVEFLRNFVVGSDSWYVAEYRSLRQYSGAQARVINSYGVTEAAIDSTFFDESIPDLSFPDQIVPIGRPFPGTHILLLDENLQLVPMGVAGELCIGGAGLARGYLNRRDLTAEKFVPHPFSAIPGARLYRTGDLARYLPDGAIEMVGRTDHLVKLRGFRIELGEIEAVLAQHHSVNNAVVVARAISGNDKELVAYCVCNDPLLTVPVLRDFLLSKLPAYMVPSSFVFLDALPLLSNGKIDRQALPAPDRSRSQREAAYVPPRDNLESNLCEIWADLLQISPVGINDNFFALGGHSLLALRLIATVEKRFHRTLPLGMLFQKGTIKEVAASLREQLAPPTSALVAINPSGSRPPVFFVHVGSGNVLCYFDLARYLGPDQPFYGLQDPSLSGVVPPFGSLEEMAAFYVREVRSVQPAGPYLIGGWSFGGLVAFEMARQFSASGHQPVLLAVLDSGTADMEREFESRMDDAALLAILAHEMYLPISSKDLRVLEPEERLRVVADHMTSAGVIFEDTIGYLRRQLNIFKYRNRATVSYFPDRYSGRVSLFLASQHDPEDDSPQWDLEERWARVAQAVDVYYVPGSHHEIAREPHVRNLAEVLNNCIYHNLGVAGYLATDRTEAAVGNSKTEFAAR